MESTQEHLTRIYYSNPSLIVMGDPYDGNHPVVILRHQGIPSKEEWSLINRALSLCGMKLINEPSFRPDGLWYHPIKEVIKDGEKLCSSN